MIKKFNKEKLDFLHKIIGKRLINIFYQPTKGILSDCNMFVINFGGNKINYSLHVFSFLRARDENNILLTSADEFFDLQYKHLSNEEFSRQKNFEKSLISVRIKNVKALLKKARVQNVEIKNCGDITIHFDNNLVLQVFIDCSYEGYEYYRILEIMSTGEDCQYVVKFYHGELMIDLP